MQISSINLSSCLVREKNQLLSGKKKTNPISFKRSWSEHQSWGVRIDGDYPSAKIFTFPDAKKVSIEVSDGNSDNKKIYELEKKQDGVFEKKFEKGAIKPNDEYSFIIERSNGSIEKVKDPYSFRQPTLLGPSVAYNQSAYRWTDSSWYSKTNADRISRRASKDNSYKSLKQAKIYEMHIATLTKKANFEGAIQELQRIKDFGFNAIEIMPVENTFSYNWGYDGVDKFSPAQYLGGADKLKDLINAAHNIGLNVIMDMVPNHIGVDGSLLRKTGPYTSGKDTPWGDAFNYEGENSKYVRDYMVNAALNWIHNYHCDGLRLDMTKFMDSDTEMQQIAAEVNYHFPDAFLIAEDARSNISVRGDEYWHDWWQPHDQRVTTPLKPDEIGFGENEDIHNQKIDNIQNGNLTLARLGCDSEWDFHFYHTISKLPYGEVDLDGLERAIFDSQERVKYSTSHDETGNMDGTRLVAKYMVPILNLREGVYLDNKDIKRAKDYVEYMKTKNKDVSFDNALDMVKSQKTQQISMKLAQMVQDGRLDKIFNMPRKNNFFNEVVLPELGINSNFSISPDKVLSAFKDAVRIYRAIEALRYFAPGPVMTFQGEENIQMAKFNFFREFDSIKNEEYLYLEKGYPYGYQAYQDSILANMQYSKSGLERMSQFANLIKDLNRFKEDNPASTVGHVVLADTVKHYQNPTFAMHAKDDASNNEVFIISNFSSLDYPSYDIEFPSGKWVEIINTNDAKYGGTNTCQNNEPVFGLLDGRGRKSKVKIALPAKSSVIFVKQ